MPYIKIGPVFSWSWRYPWGIYSRRSPYSPFFSWYYRHQTGGKYERFACGYPFLFLFNVFLRKIMSRVSNRDAIVTIFTDISNKVPTMLGVVTAIHKPFGIRRDHCRFNFRSPRSPSIFYPLRYYYGVGDLSLHWGRGEGEQSGKKWFL